MTTTFVHVAPPIADGMNHWSAGLRLEVLEMLAGRQLGSGVDRQVFECAIDPNLVIKVEPRATGGRFQNVLEWRMWEEAKDCAHIARWLAPCRRISIYGSVLIQERTDPVPPDALPRQAPGFFCDFKAENWGRLRSSGRIVCHDYGLNTALGKGLNARMRRAKWRP